MLSEEQVRHIAKLARVELKDDEVLVFSKQLSEILDYMEILESVDTDGVKETSQVTGLSNVLQEDVIKPSQSGREELLSCSELPIDSNQVRVMKVLK